MKISHSYPAVSRFKFARNFVIIDPIVENPLLFELINDLVSMVTFFLFPPNFNVEFKPCENNSSSESKVNFYSTPSTEHFAKGSISIQSNHLLFQKTNKEKEKEMKKM
jgi:hypothetical protein